MPWAIYYAAINKWHKKLRIIAKERTFFIVLLLAPIITVLIFIGSWPYLWQDPVEGIKNVLGFYKDIGTTSTFDERYLIKGGFNIYPVIWIIVTTAIPTLFLSCLGFLFGIKNIFKEKKRSVWIIMFMVSRCYWKSCIARHFNLWGS